MNSNPNGSKSQDDTSDCSSKNAALEVFGRPLSKPTGRHFLNGRNLSLATLALTALLFQNFDFSKAWKVNLIPINESARVNHAKELLGKKYEGSSAQHVEKATSLGMAIFNEVHASLPKKFKSHAVKVATVLIQESEKYEVDPVFVMAVIKTESSFNPMAKGAHGEIGLMQLKPDTAEWIAKKYGIRWSGPKTLQSPSQNIRIGMAYFDYLRDRFDGHASKYVAAYNMGATKVCRMYASEQKPRVYSTKVMANYNATYRKLATVTTLSLLAGGAY